MRNNPRFQYVNFDKKNPVFSIITPREIFSKIFGFGIIFKQKNDINYVKMYRGETLQFTNEELNCYFTIAHSNMTLERKKIFFKL